MKISIWALLAWSLAFAVIAIGAYYRGPRWLYLVCRPLAMVLLVSLVIEAGGASAPAYRAAVAAGLLVSLAGDLCMMPRRKRFAAGLAAFLVAQICYTFAFVKGARLALPAGPALGLLAYSALLIILLYPGLKRMRVPVLIYILAIGTMALAALARYEASGTPATLSACVGATFFLASDSVLAFDRFVRPFKSAQAVILSTYFTAQALIALSACL